ncbi:Protein of unknown function [Pyronema omphalodes CBS 100304]|uniref:Uncharacterized protein n=1 Tax=Pyronema omphalodes (strain CBS 100304) TaxID=1076935 RepID=U4LS96_PYROM|nr:Protein of unknown function [Pyronema omphalodes CBS 100304]
MGVDEVFESFDYTECQL